MCNSTECLRDLDKFNLIWWFDFKLNHIFTTAPAASKILLASKVVKSDPKNNHLIYFIKVQSQSLMHSVVVQLLSTFAIFV